MTMRHSTSSAPAIPARSPMESSLTQDMLHNQSNDDNDESRGIYRRTTSTNTTSASEDSQRCLIDFCEWWCYKIITTGVEESSGSASSVKQIQDYSEESIKALENLFGSSNTGSSNHVSDSTMSSPTNPSFGRFFNRTRLASLSLDVAMLGTDSSTDSNQLHEYWNGLREELILMKTLLVRQDANEDVVLISEDQRQDFLNATPNLQTDQHPLFQSHYKKILRLCQVQYQLQLFHSRLIKANASSSVSSSSSQVQVRRAIAEYEKHINHLFTAEQQTAAVNNNSDNVSVMSVSSHDVRALPSDLVGFLLKDLYQSKKSHQSSNSNNSTQSNSNNPLATRLLKHVESILQGDGPYSQATAQTAIRSLLQSWHEEILEQPMLVKLGYGDVSHNSSNRRKRQAHAEEDALLRRLSSCGGQPMENVSDIGEDDDEDNEIDQDMLDQHDNDNNHNNDNNKRRKIIENDDSQTLTKEQEQFILEGIQNFGRRYDFIKDMDDEGVLQGISIDQIKQVHLKNHQQQQQR